MGAWQSPTVTQLSSYVRIPCTLWYGGTPYSWGQIARPHADAKLTLKTTCSFSHFDHRLCASCFDENPIRRAIYRRHQSSSMGRNNGKFAKDIGCLSPRVLGQNNVSWF